MFIDVGIPHAPEFGVKVCVVVPITAVLMVAGFQVPVTPLFDVVGNTGAVLFWQSGLIWVNAGATWDVMTTSMVAVAPH
jgi:hypothetical protein